MSFGLLALFALALLVNSGSPGPSVAALVARVLTQGWRSVLPFLAAMWIGEAMWLVAAVLGLGYVAAQFYVAFSFIKYAGVAYLLFLAWKMWNLPAEARAGALPQERSGLRMFLAGLAITLGNPKIMVFYLALLPSLIDINRVTGPGLAELVAIAVAVLMTTDLAWVLAAAQARRWLKSARAVRIVNRSGAAAMGGAAVIIATH
jgi:threonine/homoserine/homoserine lactone efflux protein